MIARVRPALAAVILGLLLSVGARPTGPLPALGRFLDPWHGIWGVATTAELPRKATASIPHLGHPVRVIYDDRSVPHIFAQSETDASRALGYVVARDRLLQLELQAKAGAGRLTELVGKAAILVFRLDWPGAPGPWAEKCGRSAASTGNRHSALGIRHSALSNHS